MINFENLLYVLFIFVQPMLAWKRTENDDVLFMFFPISFGIVPKDFNK